MSDTTFFDTFPKSEITNSNRILHTPSEFAKNNLLYVQEVGTLKSLKSHCCKRENLDSFLILIVLSGSGVLTYQDEFYNLKASDIALIDCKQPYSHQSSEDEPWELMWVHFNGISAQGYVDYYHHKAGSIVLTLNSIVEFRKLIAELMTVQTQDDYTTEVVSAKIIAELLALFFVTLHKMQGAENDYNAKLAMLREKLASEYTKKIDIKKLAKYSGLQADTLEEEFEKSFGISMREYVISRKLTSAKELLRFTMKSMNIIAKDCGFSSEEEFIQIFQSRESITPIQYKMRW